MTTILPFLIVFNIIFHSGVGVYIKGEEYIERDVIPREYEENYLQLKNHFGNPLITYSGYNQEAIIYTGDFKDIYSIIEENKYDFILVESNNKNLALQTTPILITSQINKINLKDKENSLKISNEVIYLELKRFKFMITKQYSTDIAMKYDSQFFVLADPKGIEEINQKFSVEQIFLLSENYDNAHIQNIAVLPENYIIEFMCNSNSYNYTYSYK